VSPGLPWCGLAIWGPPWFSERCVACEVHRIHAHSYGRQALTSKLFSLFCVWSQAKYVGEFAACMEEIIREEGERVCTPPPPEERAVVEALTSAVAGVDEEYLARAHRGSARRGSRT
jgi:hypothetical protein